MSSIDKFVRTVLGDRTAIASGAVYAHEHLILDSPLIAAKFPHILLDDVEAAVAEVTASREAGAVLMIDAMPVSAGRDPVRLAEVSRRTGVDVVAATGLHHDRYYGPAHWTNRVAVEQLVDLFIQDLIEGMDRFDLTGPVVQRTRHKAGIVKVATSGPRPTSRDLRVLEAAARASMATGAPILTHCEGGEGGLSQIATLQDWGVPTSSIILSHVDKTNSMTYLEEIAETGAIIELDQGLRQSDLGTASITVRAIFHLVDRGHAHQLVVGTDGARRSLWTAFGGYPGLAWLASDLPVLLRRAGLAQSDISDVMGRNAARALRWRTTGVDCSSAASGDRELQLT